MKKSDFRILQQQCVERIRTSRHHFIRTCAFMPEVFEALRETHAWKFDTGDSLLQSMQADSEPGWAHLDLALLEDLEALTIVHAWKVQEATASAVWCLNNRRLASAAMAARGAFEAATASTDVRIKWMKMRDEVNARGGLGAPGTNDLVQNFENKTVRALWGRRRADDESTHKAINIMSHIGDLSKRLGNTPGPTAEIKAMHPKVYSLLSGVAHPSADGNQVFWRVDAVVDLEPSMLVPLNARSDFRDAHVRPVVDAVLWALGWSSQSSVGDWKSMSEDRQEAFRRFTSRRPE
jgi:hypothetical protein